MAIASMPYPEREPGGSGLLEFGFRIGRRRGEFVAGEQMTAVEKAVLEIRREVFTVPAGTKIDGGTKRARALGVSHTMVLTAMRQLEREGLVAMVSGSGTRTLARRPWRIDFAAGGTAPAEVAGNVKRLDQPAVTDAETVEAGDVVRLTLVVESATLPGAVTAALPIAEQAFGGAATSMSAGEA